MALELYTIASDPASKISLDGAFTNPVLLPLDGRAGGIIEKKLYVRNSNVLFYYQTVTLFPSATGVIPVDTAGYSWKFKEGNTQPTTAEWALITNGNTISFANFGSAGAPDTSTYRPFWIRVEVPENVAVKTFSIPKIKISADQVSV